MVTTSSVPDTSQGALFSYQLSAAYGTAPYSWTLTTGALPNGVRLDSTGWLTGTPRAPYPYAYYPAVQTYNFGVQAQDSRGNTAAASLALNVQPAPDLRGPSTCVTYSSPSPLPSPGPSGSTGSLGPSPTPVPSYYPCPPPASPPAVCLSPSPSPSPTPSPGSYCVPSPLPACSPSAATSPSPSPSYSSTPSPSPTYSPLSCIPAPSPSSTPRPMPDFPVYLSSAEVGRPYLGYLYTRGGVAPYTVTLISGSPPPGLAWDALSQSFSGTATAAGEFDLGFRVADAAGSVRYSDVRLLVQPPLALGASGIGVLLNAPYYGSFAHTGGVYPLSLSYTSNLPSSLVATSYSASGYLRFSGTPAAGDFPLCASYPCQGQYSVTVTMTDAAGAAATQTYAITIADQDFNVTFNPTPAPLGTIAVPYGPYSRFSSVTHGAPPYRYCIAPDRTTYVDCNAASAPTAIYAPGGTTASGLRVDPATGAISGTPTVSGPLSFTLVLADERTEYYYPMQLAIQDAGTTLAVLTTALDTAEVGRYYGSAMVFAEHASSSATWTVSGLPPGLTLTGSGPSAAVSGTPSADPGCATYPCSYSVAVTVTDGGASNTGSIAILVEPAITLNPTPGPLSLTIGTSYVHQTYTVSGGLPIPNSGYLAGVGSLPPGLTIASVWHSNFTLYGTPQIDPSCSSYPCHYSGTIYVSDGTWGSTAFPLTVTVSNGSFGLAAIPAGLPVAESGATYYDAAQPTCCGVQLPVGGGTPPYSLAATGGALPAGLSLSSSGLLTGYVTAAPATYTFTVTGTDSAGTPATATQTYSITVLAGITGYRCCGPATWVADVGVPYAFTSPFSGGQTPYTFSLIPYSGYSFPPGLSLNSSTGAITGTPTAAGRYLYEVLLTDSAGYRTYLFFNQRIAAGAPTPVTSSLAGFSVGTAYAAALTATGGTPHYAWGLSAGTLPPGLSLDDFGHITGVPSAGGSYTFTVQVIDAAGGTGTVTLTLTGS